MKKTTTGGRPTTPKVFRLPFACFMSAPIDVAQNESAGKIGLCPDALLWQPSLRKTARLCGRSRRLGLESHII